MGIDAPLVCLSKKTRSFFDYFYQLFAQVTNPPIDALREHMVTSTTLYLGNHGNLLEDSRTACQLVRLERPLLSEEEFDRICAIDRVGFKTRRFRAVYRRDAGEGALQAALKQLAEDVEAAVRDGVNIVVLSDRAAAGEVPVPSLLAVGCVHNHLIRAGVRTLPTSWWSVATPCPRTTLRRWWATPRAASIRTTRMRAFATWRRTAIWT